MQFYDVVAGGHRTALTRTQISGLFQAGQLAGNDLCKEAEQAEWRTIEELFPLLKCGTSPRSLYQPDELHSPRPRVVALTAAISIFVISAGALAGYFFWRSGAQASRNATSPTAAVNPRPPVTYTIENPYFPSQQERAAQERLKAAQRAREQLETARLAEERAAAEKKERDLQEPAGRTERIPFDQSSIVPNVGGSDVTVKIHDNDATTFDVWIDGTRRRRVAKRKGTSGSLTDETLIYSNSRARLYYVNESSGKPNHCLLRVRDE